MLMNNCLEYSTSIAHHLHHQEQESWSMKGFKIEQHVILMDQMYGTLSDHRYTEEASNFLLKAPNPIELQK